MNDQPQVAFVCCFCGLDRENNEPITLAAFWEEEGRQREQYWGAHRACLIERMGSEARDLYGGPLFGN